MEGKVSGIRWGVEQRLEFIEFRLFWEGGINRSDIMDYFGVSVPQASKDLSQYQERAPGNMEYDKREKRYLATDSFKPLYLNPSVDRYLDHLHSLASGAMTPEEAWFSEVPPFETLKLPHRNIDPDSFRAVLDAIRQADTIDIKYQSMSADRPEPVWRRITPHAFGHDGMRWHVRAYCHINGAFKDFLLSRILKYRKGEGQGPGSEEDRAWHETVMVVLTPHPDLTPAQQSIVARDYGMKDMELSLEIRLALLYYFLKRLNLDFKERNRPAREQHVVLANTEQVRHALETLQSGEYAAAQSARMGNAS